MKNLNRIITAKDYSRDEGADGTVLGRIKKEQEKWRMRGTIVQIKQDPSGTAVYAEINQGAWIAQCECGGAEFVDPAEPIFFCWGCVNRANGGYLRTVVFPENREAIESEILKRPVNDVRGVSEKDRAFLSMPVVVIVDEENGTQHPATRSWIPGETVEDLRIQNMLIDDILKEKKQ